MAETRTPKTATVLHGWLRGHPFPLTTDPEEREAEFWRWLAAHDRETAARAWDEGAEAGYDDAEAGREEKRNPYREGDPTWLTNC